MSLVHVLKLGVATISAFALTACTQEAPSEDTSSSDAIVADGSVSGADAEVLMKGLLAMGAKSEVYTGASDLAAGVQTDSVTCFVDDKRCVASGATKDSPSALARGDAKAFYDVIFRIAGGKTSRPLQIFGNESEAVEAFKVSCGATMGLAGPACSYDRRGEARAAAPQIPLDGTPLSADLQRASDVHTYTIEAPALARYEIVVQGDAFVHVDIIDAAGNPPYAGDRGSDTITTRVGLTMVRLLDPAKYTVRVTGSPLSSPAEGHYTIRFWRDRS